MRWTTTRLPNVMDIEHLPSPHRELAWLLAESLAVHILVADPDEVVVWANDTACAALGRSRAELDGARLQSLLPDADAERLARMLDGTSPPDPRLTLNFCDRAQSPFTLTIALCSAAGYTTLVGERDERIEQRAQRELMEVNQELALLARERTRAAERERQAAAAAEKAVRSRDNAIATIVHELRQPLGVMGFSLEVMRRAGDEGSRESGRARLERQVEHLAVMVADLLDVSRIQQGKLVLSPQRVDLAELVQDVTESYRSRADRAGVTLTLQRPATAVPMAVDQVRLTQVLSNLIENAIKFSPPDGRVDVALVHDDGGATFTVRDSGRGIAHDALPHVFELFAQEAGGEKGGLGIGLAVSRAIVEAHRGVIEARSNGPGAGAEFVVRLPAALEIEVDSDDKERAAAARSARSPA